MSSSIMVVNDSQTILAMFREILTAEGHQVHLRLFRQHDILQEINAVKPDLLILDCSAGKDSDGWQLLHQLRQDPATQYLPVIICSTDHRFFSETTNYLMSERVIVLAKPFDIEDLFDAMRQAVKLNQLARDKGSSTAVAGTGV
jgi:two-component system, OmpR family, response regulator VicR